MEKANNEGKEVAQGVLYANVVDTDNDNAYVGHCAYTQHEYSECSDGATNLIPEKILTCYFTTDAC